MWVRIPPRLPIMWINTVRFLLLTIVYGAAFFTAAYFGWLTDLWLTDTLHISKGIFIAFCFYSLLCFWKIFSLERELIVQSSTFTPYINAIKNNSNKNIHVENLGLFIQSKIAIIRRGSNSLVLLGLIGTIIGFILGLSGVDPSAVGNAENVANMVISLLHGMHIAFYTTLVGTVLHFCLNLYNRLLDETSAKVVNWIITTNVK